MFNPYPTTIFCPENVCVLRLLHNIQVHFRFDFFHEAKTMNPDQTALKGAVLSGVYIVCNNGYLRT